MPAARLRPEEAAPVLGRHAGPEIDVLKNQHMFLLKN
jgi:hypothetical protein